MRWSMFVPHEVGDGWEFPFRALMSGLVGTMNGVWMWGDPPGSFFLRAWRIEVTSDGEGWLLTLHIEDEAPRLVHPPRADWSFLDPALPVM